MTVAQFIATVRKAEPGERIVYHDRFLAEDREVDAAAHALGEGAFFLYEAGVGALVQQRQSEARYNYILCIRRSPTISDMAILQRVMEDAKRDAKARIAKRATRRQPEPLAA